jgi:single-stranded-DNA-specific exonuclease
MSAAVERLLEAREKGEPVLIFGDYDVDGVTSTALLLQVLQALGWKVDYYLPRRMDEGYGLSREAVENCFQKSSARVLLAVDCGSTSVDSIASLNQRGVDVLVLDHHQVSQPPPAALALVNPRLALVGRRSTSPISGATDVFSGVRASSGVALAQPAYATSGNESAPLDQSETTVSSDFTELCSVGLAFKLAHALVKQGRKSGLPGAADFDLRPLLDLVALGTIADLVPLIGENRILVAAGLERLKDTKRPGLIALKRVAQCSGSLAAFEIAFQLAPRLNAAGRLETAEESLRLLLASDLTEAMALAVALDARNRERQSIERKIAEEVLAAVRGKFKPEQDYVIVEGQVQWHIGVVGIVASRVLQQFYRPTIILGSDTDQWRGSGRSIAGFDLAAALRECGDLLLTHGGHAMAAGLSLLPEKIDAFRNRLNDVARRVLQPDKLHPQLRLDAQVGLEEMTLECLQQLNSLHPIGQGNPEVQFFSPNIQHARPLQRIGTQKQHVKLWPTDGTTVHEAVWWGAGNESLPVGTFDLAFAPELNDYNGYRSVQLKVLDWRASSGS